MVYTVCRMLQHKRKQQQQQQKETCPRAESSTLKELTIRGMFFQELKLSNTLHQFISADKVLGDNNKSTVFMPCVTNMDKSFTAL